MSANAASRSSLLVVRAAAAVRREGSGMTSAASHSRAGEPLRDRALHTTAVVHKEGDVVVLPGSFSQREHALENQYIHNKVRW